MKINEQLNKAQEFLNSSVMDGWYPYSIARGKTPSMEASSWVLIAMLQSNPELAKKIMSFLLANQNEDGGWSTGPGIGESDWTSGVVVLALRLQEPSTISPCSGKSFARVT